MPETTKQQHGEEHHRIAQTMFFEHMQQKAIDLLVACGNKSIDDADDAIRSIHALNVYLRNKL